MKILEFESLPSTNDYAKAHAEEGDMIVTAKRQTAGRGSKNRSFDSGMGGVYLTKMTFYPDFPASDVFRIMTDSSVAVCRTMEDFGLSPSIKWPNDVFVGGKKICGILIENAFSGERVSRSVVGIGVNVQNDLPEQLQGIATTMKAERGDPPDTEEVKKRLIFHLQERYPLSDYVAYLTFLGRKIVLVRGGERCVVTAKAVDEKGRLIVENGAGRVEAVAAGEVSLRFLEEGTK